MGDLMLDFNEHRRSSDTSEAKEALLEIVRMEGDEGESEEIEIPC